MARKKIVFVIVEGPSDEEVIGTMLTRILDKDLVHVHTVRGDITSQNGVSSSNILTRLAEMVNKAIKDNPFKKSDFKEVIHIVDMDGAYIKDNNIVEDSEINETFYSQTNIITKNKNGIINRNKQKSSVLNRLMTSKCVCGSIPYSCYYMSCNLDHVFYNKMNSTDEEKEKDSLAFTRKYKEYAFPPLNCFYIV